MSAGGFAPIAGAIIGAGSAFQQSKAAAKLNKKNRAFSEYQRITAHQVERQDLEAAGYNPLFAFHGSGGGANAPGYSTFQEGGDYSGSLAKATDAFETIRQSKAKHSLARNQAAANNAAANLSATKGATEVSQAALNRAGTAKTKAETKLLDSRLPGAQMEAAIDANSAGKVSRVIRRIIDTVNPLKQGFKGRK